MSPSVKCLANICTSITFLLMDFKAEKTESGWFRNKRLGIKIKFQKLETCLTPLFLKRWLRSFNRERNKVIKIEESTSKGVVLQLFFSDTSSVGLMFFSHKPSFPPRDPSWLFGFWTYHLTTPFITFLVLNVVCNIDLKWYLSCRSLQKGIGM